MKLRYMTSSISCKKQSKLLTKLYGLNLEDAKIVHTRFRGIKILEVILKDEYSIKSTKDLNLLSIEPDVYNFLLKPVSKVERFADWESRLNILDGRYHYDFLASLILSGSKEHN